jgi:hypothetical protein
MTKAPTSVSGTELFVSGMNEKEWVGRLPETSSSRDNSVFFGMAWAQNYLERILKEREELDKQVRESVYYREWVHLRKMIMHVSDFYGRISLFFLYRALTSWMFQLFCRMMETRTSLYQLHLLSWHICEPWT